MWFEWSQEKLKAIPGKDNKPFLIYFPKVFWKEKILNFADTSTKLTSKLLLARRRPTLLSKAIKFEEIVVQIGDLQIVKSENFLMFVSWKLKRLSFTGGWTTTSSLLGLLAIVDAALNKDLKLWTWSSGRLLKEHPLMASSWVLKIFLNRIWINSGTSQFGTRAFEFVICALQKAYGSVQCHSDDTHSPNAIRWSAASDVQYSPLISCVIRSPDSGVRSLAATLFSFQLSSKCQSVLICLPAKSAHRRS